MIQPAIVFLAWVACLRVDTAGRTVRGRGASKYRSASVRSMFCTLKVIRYSALVIVEGTRKCQIVANTTALRYQYLAMLRMKLRPGICPFPALGLWGKCIMPYSSTMAYRRYFPTTTGI